MIIMRDSSYRRLSFVDSFRLIVDFKSSIFFERACTRVDLKVPRATSVSYYGGGAPPSAVPGSNEGNQRRNGVFAFVSGTALADSTVRKAFNRTPARRSLVGPARINAGARSPHLCSHLASRLRTRGGNSLTEMRQLRSASMRTGCPT